VSIGAPDLDRLADFIAARLAEHLRHQQPQLIDRPELARRLGLSERGLPGWPTAEGCRPATGLAA
jgi:hypothetical protein